MIERAYDATLAGSGLVLSSPLWLLFASEINLEDGGPVFYAQTRVGLDAPDLPRVEVRSGVVPGRSNRLRFTW